MIKHIIFDLGQVIVTVALEPFFIKFAEAFNINPVGLKESEDNGAHREFMTGNITGDEFHRKTCEYFNHLDLMI